MLAKPVAGGRFSVLAFGLTQIAMDVEPLVAMVAGWPVLHGWSHTFLGALLIASGVALASPPLLRWLVAFLFMHARVHRLEWIMDAGPPSRAAVWSGALFGTLSHVALDGFMHADMRPWAPFSVSAAWMGMVDHDDIYAWCAAAFVFGSVAWLIARWRGRQSS